MLYIGWNYNNNNNKRFCILCNQNNKSQLSNTTNYRKSINGNNNCSILVLLLSKMYSLRRKFKKLLDCFGSGWKPSMWESRGENHLLGISGREWDKWDSLLHMEAVIPKLHGLFDVILKLGKLSVKYGVPKIWSPASILSLDGNLGGLIKNGTLMYRICTLTKILTSKKD